MKVTDSDGERVRRIVRLRDALERKQHANHLLDLMFFGVAVADDRLLDESRAVFMNL